MKKLVLFFATISISFVLNAQTMPLDSILAHDVVFKNINDHLPEKWKMEINDTTITILSLEKYVLFNSNCADISADSLKNAVYNRTAMLSFRYEDKWEAERLFWVRESNDSINMLLASLPQQMGVVQFFDKEKSTRFNKVYTGKTKEEKEKVNAYYKRRGELMSYYETIPNFNTVLFSLKQSKQTGMQRPGQCIYPSNIYKEALSVYILFLDYCENPLENK
jgi:hypothetical protein